MYYYYVKMHQNVCQLGFALTRWGWLGNPQHSPKPLAEEGTGKENEEGLRNGRIRQEW